MAPRAAEISETVRTIDAATRMGMAIKLLRTSETNS
jgi:hypothetical protein